MKCKAVLSSLSNEPFHLYQCQIPTCFAAREVFDTKSHPFELCSGRVKLESSICAMVRRIFKFQSQSKIVVFLIHLIIKNYVIFLILRNSKIWLTIAQIMLLTFALPDYSLFRWDLAPKTWRAVKQVGIWQWYRWSGSLLREDRTALYLMQRQTKGTTLIRDHGFVML